MTSIAAELAHWATDLEPSEADLELAQRAVLDTIAVAVAARNEPDMRMAAGTDRPA